MDKNKSFFHYRLTIDLHLSRNVVLFLLCPDIGFSCANYFDLLTLFHIFQLKIEMRIFPLIKVLALLCKFCNMKLWINLLAIDMSSEHFTSLFFFILGYSYNFLNLIPGYEIVMVIKFNLSIIYSNLFNHEYFNFHKFLFQIHYVYILKVY